ncbi:multisubunit sodium/proton antiporter, MrpD subunit [Anaerobranca californiensis DSM 14826]|jgi:multicomponent Na+:H+ antiporter subunit D|uniref:Multisubunit sodium/proton antiporter, MrpD subunit n=1 Tax=Anaerobranca californiensis DSM 14826 TaxID=1120989 RepID=A0A1M6NJY5_9FIRM|nr:NADH-quinone oxidoreductase subunit M [Anaerobranca californiensis]SHJ96007.1 multisubunit sodium/proton antiporter, MrpD subunit [Anaerobranca californiensis DSM 14826]
MREQIINFLPVWAVLLPIVSTIPLFIIEQKSAKLRDWFAVVISTLTFLLVLAMYSPIKNGQVIYLEYPRIFPPFGISFRVDFLGYVLALISSFVWLLCVIYSKEYMCNEHSCNRFYPFLLLSLGGCLGVVLTGDLFSLFLFFELMSLASYVLVVHEESPAAMKAGYKYLMLTLVGGLALFFGIVITFEVLGTVSFNNTVMFEVANGLAFTAFLSYLIGFGMKMGIFPLHVWLPDAHPVAPSPASALLSGIMLKTGAYGLLRVIYQIFGPALLLEANWHKILLVLAGITIFLGSAVAIAQTDLKRRLAYSSIGQMGYILLGMSLLTENALIGDIFHILSHAMMKSLLFLAAGIIIFKTGKKQIADLKGIGYEMPITMICFTVAALAMIGIPPFNGYVSKLLLSIGALDAGHSFYVLLLIISSLMNGVYYLPIIIAAFFGKGDSPKNKVPLFKEAAPAMLFPIVILAAFCLIFGLFPRNLALELSELAAKLLLGRG